MNKNKLRPLALSVALISGAYMSSAYAVDSCGYTVETGTTSTWNSGYQGFVRINNISGEAASDFQVLLKSGSSTISSVFNSQTSAGQGGLIASAPDWLRWSPISQGSTYELGFLANGQYENFSAELLSVNGDACSGQQPPPPPPPPVDDIDPEAGLSPSQSNFSAPGTLVLDAFAVDNVGVTKVVFLRNGTVIGEDASAPYSFQVALGESDNGTQSFSAVAYDAAGNTGASNSVSVVVDISSGDTVHPETGMTTNQISFTDPGTLIIDAFAVDNVGIAKVVFLRDGQPIGEDSSYPYSFQVPLTAADNGSYVYSVVAYDAAGNTGTSNILTVEVNIGSGDTISPEGGLAANQSSFTEAGTLVLDAFAVDNVGVTKVEFKRNGVVIGESTSQPYSLSVPLTAADNGVLTFLATAYDAAGNSGDTNPVVVSVDIAAGDDIKPEVGINPSAIEYGTGDTITIDAFAVDNVGVEKVVFLRDGEVVFEDTTAPYHYEKLVSNENGTYSFSAIAYDAAGNFKESHAIDITITGASDRFLGTALDGSGNYGEVSNYFNQVTPGNAGKWGSLEPQRDVMNWGPLDAVYQYAKDNDMPFKLHTLVWGQQAPAWLDDLGPGEQMGELAQLMYLISERYPDIDMIDVVNEPLHAPAKFSEALGGAGATGWDWVITAFSMARSYFPDSKLLINDYNILMLDQYTQDYLEIIETLQQTTMLDGIGIQAHFLERADTATVAANLQTLADTGLPIYISELDVDFADDARQANVLKDLFSTFWANPAVKGITYWGYEQGKMWREDSYLLRTDGSERPAMEWMQCFYTGGSNCTVPEYVPAGWTGDEYGVTLEAELYDEAHGVLALGSSVAYTDDGDWLKFFKVNFDENWNKAWLTYIKGNDSATSISLHLDSLDSSPVATFDLETTGGWSTSKQLELDIPSITGQHDVFVKFNGGYGVGNMDKVRFGKPVTSGLGPNLIADPGFESGSASGWFSWDGSVTTSAALTYEGNYSLRLTGREGNGPAAYSLFGDVEGGSVYRVSLMVTIDGALSADVNITQKIACEGEDDAYSWLVSPATVTAGEWTEFTGNLVVPSNCTLTDVAFFAEGPAGGIDLYLDNVSVQQVVSSVDVLNSDFEDGTAGGWTVWGGSLEVVPDNVHGGNYSLMHTDRDATSAVVYNLTGDVMAATDYQVSLAVAIEGAADAPVHITRKIECDGEEATYNWLASDDAVAEGEWAVLNGSLSLPDCSLSEVLIYVEGPGAGINVLLDDVVVSQ